MNIHDPKATTADTESSIRRSLAGIRRAIPVLANPPANTTTSRRSIPASRPPTPTDPLSLLTEITRDLAYWVHAMLDDNPDPHLNTVPIDAHDPNATAWILTDNAAWCSGWSHGYRLAWELEDLAAQARALAWPRTAGTILLGPCPNTIGRDGHPVTCGTNVRANATNPGAIKCRGCGLTDTVDGWILRMVGSERLVTIPQLVPLLHKRMGVVVHERTLRRWHRAGKFAAAGGSESTPLFDRRHVFAVLQWLSERGA